MYCEISIDRSIKTGCIATKREWIHQWEKIMGRKVEKYST